MLVDFFDAILHLDTYLQEIVQQYSTLTYFLLFLVIFLETGVVVTPFLPGDSLLFAAGALAALGSFNLAALFVIIFVAAVIGDAVNYHVGKILGPKIFKKESSFLFNKAYLVTAEKFYEEHGRKTIIMARFLPIIRTFAPFVAGIGKMPYGIFFSYNILGAAFWCSTFIFGGFLFGNIAWVKEHFGLFILAIIVLSLIPLIRIIFSKYESQK